jgi:hypothetical protein
MTEQSQDFEMWAGEYKEITLTILKPDGTAEDLTGASVSWVAKTRPDANLPALVSKSTGHGAEVLTPPIEGKVRVTLEEADTAALRSRTYYHELEGRDSAGKPFTPTVGYMVIQPSAIRG